MPSDYAVVTDGAVTLPADNDDLDVDFNFDAPGILNLQPVLLYRVDPTPNLLTLKLSINGTKVHTASFNNETRTYHEAVETNVVRSVGNRLTVRLVNHNEGVRRAGERHGAVRQARCGRDQSDGAITPSRLGDHDSKRSAPTASSPAAHPASALVVRAGRQRMW